MPIKLTSTLEGYLIIKITKVNSGLHIRDNVHSHLRHAKQSMAVIGGGGGGGGGLSNDRFPWTKWDFVLKLKNCIKLYK